jgi:ATP-dependent Zn protease
MQKLQALSLRVKTDQIIKTHKKIIEKIADDLLAKETINEDEFKQYFVEPKKQK